MSILLYNRYVSVHLHQYSEVHDMVEKYLYKAHKPNGEKASFYIFDEALDYYKINHCTKLEYYTKDLFPTYTTIVDVPDFDIERIRCDMIVKMTTQARRKANNRYDSSNTKQYKMKLNLKNDSDIITYLERDDVKIQTFIKQAIREKLARESLNIN